MICRYLHSPLPPDVNGGVAEDIPQEEWGSAFLLGRLPHSEISGMRHPFSFPMNMATEQLYPIESSKYVHSDGVAYDVQCFNPGDKKVEDIKCPDPFVPPLMDGSIDPCVKVEHHIVVWQETLYRHHNPFSPFSHVQVLSTQSMSIQRCGAYTLWCRRLASCSMCSWLRRGRYQERDTSEHFHCN